MSIASAPSGAGLCIFGQKVVQNVRATHIRGERVVGPKCVGGSMTVKRKRVAFSALSSPAVPLVGPRLAPPDTLTHFLPRANRFVFNGPLCFCYLELVRAGIDGFISPYPFSAPFGP
ncbi:hypothetical protein CEXT_146451 [Caerostris extrusa]|uniref:Uncharacterized protein n=1 Tax=Caerostris extrusa TaxID=172846 RepID=A0AAV4MH35_CAEEX|nr:hypothetical protein CEXT_146451 [Caerostris extrusa]